MCDYHAVGMLLKILTFLHVILFINGSLPLQERSIGFQRVPRDFKNVNVSPDEEFKKYSNESSLEARFLNPLNPFGIFGTPRCQHQGFEGICFEAIRCWALSGKVGPICRKFQGTCCRFFRECGQRSSQEVVYFSNYRYSQFPFARNIEGKFADLPPDCDFRVVRRNSDTCGLRIIPTIDRSVLTSATVTPSSTSSGNATSDGAACADTVLSITGLTDRLDLNLCATRDAVEKRKYDIKIKDVEHVTISISSIARRLTPVDVKLEQLTCEEFSGEDLAGTSLGPITSGGSEITGGITAVTTTTKATTEATTEATTKATTDATTEEGAPSPPSPPDKETTTEEIPSAPAPPNYSKCGIQGTTRRGRDKLNNVIQSLEDASRNQKAGPVGPPLSYRRHSRQDPLFENEEEVVWDVPTNEQSVFHYYSGKPSIITTRITFGIETKPKELPWQVAMFVGQTKFHCGASIIGDLYVLTAAHCVIDFRKSPGSINLRLGEWSLKTSAGGGYTTARVSEVRIHSGYSLSNHQNDIAVLKLTKPIQFSDSIRPVCLPRESISTDNKMALVSGWGKNENGQLVDKLHKLYAKVMTNQQCNMRWGNNGFIKSGMMCMDPQSGDSCNGDSGGPSVLEYPENSGKYTIIGVVSFGSKSCTDKNLPGVYTRVDQFRTWLLQQMT